jgi:ferritin-like metal-binding protein YciE
MIMQLDNLKQLYVHGLQDLYSAENQIVDALPKMVEVTHDQQLKKAFQHHLEVTRKQKKRLEQIFNQLKEEPSTSTCEGMEGIIEEGEEFIKKKDSWFSGKIEDTVLDAALIASAQKVEHYEIAGYGAARTFANQLGFKEHAALLQQTLEEEKEADRELTQLAESKINRKTA